MTFFRSFLRHLGFVRQRLLHTIHDLFRSSIQLIRPVILGLQESRPNHQARMSIDEEDVALAARKGRFWLTQRYFPKLSN